MSVYVINASFHSATARSERVLCVAEAFGLGLEDRDFVVFKDLEVLVEQGDVVYITGQSGSGKSVLLRKLTEQMRAEGKKVADLDEMKFDDRALIDQVGKDMQEAIELLSRAGINDAYLVIRKPHELSDGQRYRLKLAKLFETDADVIVADEFGAILDRVTAKTVAYSAQKLCRLLGKTLMVATTHSDLIEELGPSLTIEKRFEQRVTLTRAPQC